MVQKREESESAGREMSEDLIAVQARDGVYWGVGVGRGGDYLGDKLIGFSG